MCRAGSIDRYIKGLPGVSPLVHRSGQPGVVVCPVFMVPTAIAGEVARQYGVQSVGDTEAVREQFYAISVERKISHPAVAAITEAARAWLK